MTFAIKNQNRTIDFEKVRAAVNEKKAFIRTQEIELSKKIDIFLKNMKTYATELDRGDQKMNEGSLFLFKYNALCARLYRRHGDVNQLLTCESENVCKSFIIQSDSVEFVLINETIKQLSVYQIAERILFFDLNVNIENSEGITPLIAAVINEDEENMKSLLKFGANPLMYNANCHTALMFAVEIGNQNVIDLLRPAIFNTLL